MASTRKRIVNKLDKVFSEYIRLRDERCVCCGSKERLQCGHLFTRAAYSTRWDTFNAYCQCASCNLRTEYDAGPLTSYFIRKYGIEAYDALHMLHRKPIKFTDTELETQIERFREELRVMREEKSNSQGYV